VLFSRAKIFTLASARVLATCAKVPGRFSTEIGWSIDTGEIAFGARELCHTEVEDFDAPVAG
jgi:hypothetical protein